MTAPVRRQVTCCGCGGRDFETVFTYREPPEIETKLPLPADAIYYREYRRCRACGHMANFHDFDLERLYEGAYVDSTYGNAEDLRRTFEKIVSLPPDRSDNAGRVKRIETYADAHFRDGGPPSISLLDVGSGLGVFPHGIKRLGWKCTALDPDPRAAAHIESVIGVRTHSGDFMQLDPERLGVHDVVTFNKVLEHVVDPVAMLARARPLVQKLGFVYVEVPDVAAAADGAGREEFTIDHHHVFSPASLALMAEHAGFRVRTVERLKEPSTKYTLRLFASP